jgi:hypothetical protein
MLLVTEKLNNESGGVIDRYRETGPGVQVACCLRPAAPPCHSVA